MPVYVPDLGCVSSVLDARPTGWTVEMMVHFLKLLYHDLDLRQIAKVMGVSLSHVQLLYFRLLRIDEACPELGILEVDESVPQLSEVEIDALWNPYSLEIPKHLQSRLETNLLSFEIPQSENFDLIRVIYSFVKAALVSATLLCRERHRKSNQFREIQPSGFTETNSCVDSLDIRSALSFLGLSELISSSLANEKRVAVFRKPKIVRTEQERVEVAKRKAASLQKARRRRRSGPGVKLARKNLQPVGISSISDSPAVYTFGSQERAVEGVSLVQPGKGAVHLPSLRSLSSLPTPRILK